MSHGPLALRGWRGVRRDAALRLDVALVHLNRADAHGNASYSAPTPTSTNLFCLAAKRRFVSCERIVSTAELTADVQRRRCCSTA